MDVLERIERYNKDYCWQYDIRLKRKEKDLEESSYSEKELLRSSVHDYEFCLVKDKQKQIEMKKFIEKHEWLGKISIYTTHWFAAYYKDELAGVILFGMPTAFSNLLGKETKKIERLVNRGACISWSPKNLASSFLMWCIRYLVKNTEYRLFTAYSDPTAKELGTIYQACNFYYLGQNSGGTKKYINPYNGKLVSDRFFRARSAYKKYAKELKIEWESDWNKDSKILWENIPNNVENQLREFSKKKQQESTFFNFPKKHKYCYILGTTKKETKELKNKFLENNKIYPYPKERNTFSGLGEKISFKEVI